MKILSKTSVYGLRAMVFLASKKKTEGYVSIGEISEHLNISFHFLTKIFQTLTQHGYLESYRGPNGGVALNKPAEHIFLTELVHILEGPDFFNTCLLGLPGCGVEKPCPVHDFWMEARELMKGEFDETSLAELGDKVSDERLRLEA